MTEELGERLKAAEQLGADAAFKATAEAMIPIYSYHVVRSPHEHDEVDAQAHRETWDDMLRLQAEGIYPAAFSTINVPVLMIYGVFDPHPGRLVSSGLQRFLPQLEYRELARCGHYPWLERDAARPFFSLIREWLARHLKGP